MKTAFRIILWMALCTACTAAGAEQQFDVTLKLVKAEKPDETVDVNTSEPESLPEQADEPAAATVWPKNVQVDGQPAFEIYYRDKLVGRQASVKRQLAPGTHTIWPGDHAFEIAADGKLSSADPELIVDANTVSVKCYPVTLAAYRVNSPESTMAVDLRMLASDKLSIGVEVPAEPKKGEKVDPEKPLPPKFVDLVPFYRVFKPLTIYVPATGAGKPYNVRPGRFEMAVKPDGLAITNDGEGELGDLVIRKHRLFLPFRSYPVIGRTQRTRSCQAVFPSGGTFGVGAGAIGDRQHPAIDDELIRSGVLSRTEEVALTYSGEPHRFMAGNRMKPENRFIEVEGSLAKWPEKAFCYDNTDADNDEPRILVVERKHDTFSTGKPSMVRVQWLDAPTEVPAPDAEQPSPRDDKTPPKMVPAKPTLTADAASAPEPAFFFMPCKLDERPAAAWMRADATPADDHAYAVVPPPGLKPGAYVFRAAVCEKGKPDPSTPFCADMIVGVVDAEAGGSLSIFTQKGRDAFVCGETFYLGLAIKTAKPIPAGTPVELDATDPFGQTWPLVREKTPREIQSADSLHFWLNGDLTVRLAPGRYRVAARAAKLTAAEFAFNLVHPEKPTNFVNLLHGKYSSIEKWADNLDRSRDGQWTSEILAEELEQIGINRLILTRMGSPIGRYYRSEPERRLEDLYRTGPTLPHWQSIYYPTGRERMMNSFLRHGIDFSLDLFSYEDDGQPSHLPHVIGSQRYTALQMQAMRHNPANLGFCAFNERYSSPGSNWPKGMLEVHMQALMQRFMDTYKISTSDAMRSKERFLNRPPAQRDVADLEKFRPAGAWSDFQYDDFVRRTTEAANKTTSGLYNTTIFRSFAGVGGYITGCGYPRTMYEPLQWATTLHYKDGFGFGSAVLFTPQLADVLQFRDNLETVPAICLWGNGMPSVQIYTKQLFGGLSQRADGIATFMFGYDFQTGAGDARSDRDLMQDVYRDLLTPYGDWLRSLDRGYRQVAVYYSRLAEELSSAKHVQPDRQAEGVWIACLRAGFPADYLVDEQILDGNGERYKVLFVPGFSVEKEAPANVLAELRRLVRNGVTVIVDKRSKLNLEIDGLVRMDDGFDRFSLYTHQGFWFPNHWDADWILMEKLTNSLTALLCKELPKYVQPACESDLNISPDWLQRGELSLLVVPDFQYPKFTYEHIEQFHEPFVKELRLPNRGTVCYDVLENEPVPVKADGDRAVITADVRHYGGKLYAFLPAKIGGVRLSATKSVAAGEAIGYQVEVLDDAGRPFNASFPVKIEITAANGAGDVGADGVRPTDNVGADPRVRPGQARAIQGIASPAPTKTIYRAAAPRYEGRYVPGLNAPAGTWKIRATELISGSSAEADVAVGPSARPQPIPADTAMVWTADVQAIRTFMKAGKEIVIPLESTQQWARVQAQRLADGLRAAGVNAKLVDADDVIRPIGNNVLDAYHSWRMEVYPPPMKVEHPVIAIGKRGESRLIEALLDYSVLADVPSALHPGPGRALIQYVWNAYSVEDDLVCVSVSDDEGLRRAVDWLVGADHVDGARGEPLLIDGVRPDGADNVGADARVRPGQAQGPAPTSASVGADGVRPEPPQASPASNRTYKPAITAPRAVPANVEMAAGKPGPPEKQSFRARYSREDEVRVLSFDPASGRIIIGTKGWGHNIFCLDTDGKKLWSTYLPEHNVHRACFSPDGTRVIAGVGMPARIYVLDAAAGTIQFCFDASEYPQHRFRNVDEQNGFPFIVNPRNGDIYAQGKTGVMAVSLDGRKRWFLDRWEAMQAIEQDVIQEGSLGIEFGREMKGVALSPDGKYLATIEEVKEATTQVIRGGGPVKLPISRAETVICNTDDLAEIARHVDIRLCIIGEIFPSLHWNADSTAVTLSRDSMFWTIPISGEATSAASAPSTRRELELTIDTRVVRAFARDGSLAWARNNLPMIGWQPSPDFKQIYLLDIYGRLHGLDAATGADRWVKDTGNKGILQVLPGGDVLFGGLNGMIARFSPAGEIKWTTMLRDLHEIAGDYDKFVFDAKLGMKDISPELYPSMLDKDGDLDSVVRFGLDVVTDGSFESVGADGVRPTWQIPENGAGIVAGRTGRRAVQTTGGTVTQPANSPVIPHATYLLEFYYKPESWTDSLTAGVLVQNGAGSANGTDAAAKNAHGDVLTGMAFSGEPGKWNFGRLAVKAFSDTTGLTVGFEAARGAVAVDDVRLRPVRFASKNFLFSQRAHELKPRFVDDLSTTQRGVPRSLEADLIKQNHITWYVSGGMIGSRGESLESMVLLQNGQLDDVGKMWHSQPDPVGLNIGLTSPRYVSHIVVYFSHQFPGDAWPRFQVKANDVKIKNYVNVASVRGNRRHFCVVSFPPILTDLIYIIPVGGITQWDCTVTEIEVYGPLGGPETVKGWPQDSGDGASQVMPMFMATPSHVRPVAKLDVAGDVKVEQFTCHEVGPTGCRAVAADGRIFIGAADGTIGAWALDDRNRWNNQYRGGTGTIAISGAPAIYSARLLAPSADGYLYCLAGSDCSVQWKFQTGGRMLASPVPDGDDVYAASDDGKIYKLDVESGMMLWQFATDGKIRTSPALAGGRLYFVSWDGGDLQSHCYAVTADTGSLAWKTPVAPYSLSSPAVSGGKVFVGDEDGFAHCIDAANGKPLWKMKIGSRVSASPAVLGEQVVFAAEDGTVACLNAADGADAWRTKVPGRVRIDVLPTTSGLFVAGSDGIDLLNPSNGAKVKSFDVKDVFDMLACNGKLYLFSRGAVTVIAPN